LPATASRPVPARSSVTDNGTFTLGAVGPSPPPQPVSRLAIIKTKRYRIIDKKSPRQKDSQTDIGDRIGRGDR
jgi:hypothetical protein